MKEFLLSVFILFILQGCVAITGYQNDIDKYNNDVLTKNCNFEDDKNMINNEKDIIYTALKAGSRARFCKNFDLSNKFFDAAEASFKNSVDLKGFFKNITQGISSSVINDNILDYEGAFYERIMTNTYKALNFMSLKDFSGARVELNRALERQQRAMVFYEEEIEKAVSNINDEFKKIDNTNGYNDLQTKKLIEVYNKNLGNFTIYPNFINPFATYISGLFFTLQNDKKGAELLKQSLAMDPENLQIQKDLKFANSKSKKPKIWLVYENGLAPGLKENKIDLSMFIVSDKIFHIGLALPVLTTPTSSYESLFMNGSKTCVIADMQSVIKTEFLKTSPIRIRKAVINSMTKAMLQYAAGEFPQKTYNQTKYYQDGYVKIYKQEISYEQTALRMIFGIYSALTNRADIRYLPTLPLNFQSTSIENKGFAKITDSYENIISQINVNPNKNILIYIKSLTEGFIITDIIEF